MKEKKTRTKEAFFVGLGIASVVAFFLLVFFLRATVLFPYRVQMNSMNPTLKENNLVLVNKIAYRNHAPKRGDIVIFAPPNNPHVTYIKRIVAVPGETIEIRGGLVWINGGKIAEEYLTEETPGKFGPQTLETTEFFVLGDHRSNSLDSREFGPIQQKAIFGKAYFVIHPPKGFNHGFLTQ